MASVPDSAPIVVKTQKGMKHVRASELVRNRVFEHWKSNKHYNRYVDECINKDPLHRASTCKFAHFRDCTIKANTSLDTVVKGVSKHRRPTYALIDFDWIENYLKGLPPGDKRTKILTNLINIGVSDLNAVTLVAFGSDFEFDDKTLDALGVAKCMVPNGKEEADMALEHVAYELIGNAKQVVLFAGDKDFVHVTKQLEIFGTPVTVVHNAKSNSPHFNLLALHPSTTVHVQDSALCPFGFEPVTAVAPHYTEASVLVVLIRLEECGHVDSLLALLGRCRWAKSHTAVLVFGTCDEFCRNPSAMKPLQDAQAQFVMCAEDKPLCASDIHHAVGEALLSYPAGTANRFSLLVSDGRAGHLTKAAEDLMAKMFPHAQWCAPSSADSSELRLWEPQCLDHAVQLATPSVEVAPTHVALLNLDVIRGNEQLRKRGPVLTAAMVMMNLIRAMHSAGGNVEFHAVGTATAIKDTFAAPSSTVTLAGGARVRVHVVSDTKGLDVTRCVERTARDTLRRHPNASIILLSDELGVARRLRDLCHDVTVLKQFLSTELEADTVRDVIGAFAMRVGGSITHLDNEFYDITPDCPAVDGHVVRLHREAVRIVVPNAMHPLPNETRVLLRATDRTEAKNTVVPDYDAVVHPTGYRIGIVTAVNSQKGVVEAEGKSYAFSRMGVRRGAEMFFSPCGSSATGELYIIQ